MATATRHCDECEHFDRRIPALDSGLVCLLGHKPRFYQPYKIEDHRWGWKRRCEDFKEAKDAQP